MAIPVFAQLVVTGGFVAWSMFQSSKDRDDSLEGGVIQLRRDPINPDAPMIAGYGRPTFEPQVMQRYFRPANINKLSASVGTELVTVLSLGHGHPIGLDGRDLLIWMNDKLMIEEVKEDDDISVRRMIRITDYRFRFQQDSIVRETVVLILNDTVITGHGGKNGGFVFAENSVNVVNEKVAARRFTSANDPNIPQSEPRQGFFLPKDGIVTGAVAVSAQSANREILLRSGHVIRTVKDPVPPEDIAKGVTKIGRRYFYVREKVPNSQAILGDCILTYKVRPQVFIRKERDGFFAIFQDRQPSGDMTWRGKTDLLDGDFTYSFRDGSNKQEVAPLDDQTAQTFVVSDGELLAEGDTTTYETTNKVHDVLVEIRSGSDGFFHQRSGGPGTAGMRRIVQIMLKEQDAPDVIQPGQPGLSTPWLDLSLGWVRLRDPESQDVNFDLVGNVKGIARWFLSAADLYNNTVLDRDEPNLPFDRYSIKVIAINGPSKFDNDQDDIEFGSATEIIRVPLELPGHATLTARVIDSEKAGDQPTWRVQLAMRRPWVPERGATFNAASGLLEPGEYRWTRNHVWCAVDLITNPQFGAGEFYGWDSFPDLDELFDAADFCDDLIDGEPRSELDLIVGTQLGVQKQVLGMMAGSRVLPALAGGNFRTIIDQDETPVMDLTDDDFEATTLRRVWSSPDALPNELDLAVTLEGFDFLPTQHLVRLQGADQDPTQRITRKVAMVGVRRESQVDRHGSIALRQFQTTTQTIQGLGTTFRLHRLRAGCIVRYTSERFKFTLKKFRIDAHGYESTTFRPAIQMAEFDPSAYDAKAQVSDIQQGDTPLIADPKAPQSNQSPTFLIVSKLDARRVASG